MVVRVCKGGGHVLAQVVSVPVGLRVGQHTGGLRGEVEAHLDVVVGEGLGGAGMEVEGADTFVAGDEGERQATLHPPGAGRLTERWPLAVLVHEVDAVDLLVAERVQARADAGLVLGRIDLRRGVVGEHRGRDPSFDQMVMPAMSASGTASSARSVTR
jgi:hypothetical protein